MNIVGIIAEYNPFHKGHEYHIKKAKELTGADYCIVVMSGDFTQRGIPAIVNKHARAHMALLSGADLVFELPARYACSSAENFAAAAVQLLSKTGIVSHICFGSECGDIVEITTLSSILAKEPGSYKDALSQALRSGESFPAARAFAIAEHLRNTQNESSSAEQDELISRYRTILSSPNNTLGIEYVKELIRSNSSMIPVTISRMGQDYHGKSKINGNEFASASFIRERIESEQLNQVSAYIPKPTFELLSEQIQNSRAPILLNDFSALLKYKLLTTDLESLTEYLDVSSDLARRIKNSVLQYEQFNQFCMLLKTKELTYTRINRALLHILLGIKKEPRSDSNDLLSYAAVLGFKRGASHLLRQISDNGKLTLISKNADAHYLLSKHDLMLFEETICCSHIYESIVADKYGTAAQNQYLISPIIE